MEGMSENQAFILFLTPELIGRGQATSHTPRAFGGFVRRGKFVGRGRVNPLKLSFGSIRVL
jgi:hypothetical protein